MIELLRLQNIAVVESAELEFGSELNVLTGETGAGKSVILGALALLTGGRASPEMIRTGASEAVVEAIFSAQDAPELVARMREREIPLDENGIVVRRTLTRNGRSRAQVGGQLVPIAVLGDLFSSQVEISSQHQSQSLLATETQGRLLDERGGFLSLCEAVERSVEAWRDCEDSAAALVAAREERARRRDFLEFQIREIEEAKLRSGERDELGVERRRLVHAERLRDEVGRALTELAGSETPEETPAAIELLTGAQRALEGLVEIDPSLGGLVERLGEAGIELQDIAFELGGYAEGVELDSGRLDEVEERLAQIAQLAHKYGTSESEILAFRDDASEELRELTDCDAELKRLSEKKAVIEGDLRRDVEELSAKRVQVAEVLGREVTQSLAQLAMPDARFQVRLEVVDPSIAGICGPRGRERAEFAFSANPGEDLRPLRKVASGGELSRLFLTVKNALRSTGSGMSIVFDEVDTGIGGGVAEKVGRLLVQLAQAHQVICITHLPQIAALGGIHFVISKRARGGRTLASVAILEEKERVEEIARMAGGEKVSDATRRHAAALLEAARN